MFVAAIVFTNKRELFGTHHRFHPVTGESERQRLWFGLVISREREQVFAWYAENCGGKHAADDDPLWRTGDGGGWGHNLRRRPRLAPRPDGDDGNLPGPAAGSLHRDPLSA